MFISSKEEEEEEDMLEVLLNKLHLVESVLRRVSTLCNESENRLG